MLCVFFNGAPRTSSIALSAFSTACWAFWRLELNKPLSRLKAAICRFSLA